MEVKQCVNKTSVIKQLVYSYHACLISKFLANTFRGTFIYIFKTMAKLCSLPYVFTCIIIAKYSFPCALLCHMVAGYAGTSQSYFILIASFSGDPKSESPINFQLQLMVSWPP